MIVRYQRARLACPKSGPVSLGAHCGQEAQQSIMDRTMVDRESRGQRWMLTHLFSHRGTLPSTCRKTVSKQASISIPTGGKETGPSVLLEVA